METAEIQRRFLKFFESNGHTVVPSAPLPAFEDPNLLFVPAGMVPFVPYFLGQATPDWNRATSVQKCIRTPDIDEVGKTSRHGTFFQMNGNFSFGDYFKEQAIRFAWDLTTGSVESGGLGLDGDKIWATVYLDDDEAIDIWHKQIGLPLDRIVRRGQADNMWSMGIPGPCGPCSELYYDRGPDYGPEGGPEVDEDRYLEFWNLVFMQNIRGGGPAKEGYEVTGDLPKKNIDTGMGMERMAALLQGVDNMYETDQVRPIIDKASELTGKRYGVSTSHTASESHPDDIRFRVIGDHVRSSLMLIGDGVVPSNEGRGYVLRRLMRRAIRAVRLLGYDRPAMPELLPVAMERMSTAYPELRDRLRADLLLRLRRGRGLPQDPQARHHDPRHRRVRDEDRRRQDPLRYQGVRAARHVRLPDRPDPGDGRGAGPLGRPGGLPQAHDRAAPAREGGRGGPQDRPRGPVGVLAAAPGAGPHRLEGLRDPRDRVPGDRPAQGRPVDPRGQGRGHHRGRARPDPVLRRVGRPARRRRQARRPEPVRRGPRRAAPGEEARGPQGPRPRRRARSSTTRSRPRSTPSGVSAPARRTRARTWSTRPCARCSARPRSSPARSTGPATCAWTSRGARSSPTRRAARSKRSPTAPCATTCRSPSST